jgi:hypothetical protein
MINTTINERYYSIYFLQTYSVIFVSLLHVNQILWSIKWLKLNGLERRNEPERQFLCRLQAEVSHQNMNDYLVELVNMATWIGVTRLRILEKCPKTWGWNVFVMYNTLSDYKTGSLATKRQLGCLNGLISDTMRIEIICLRNFCSDQASSIF